MNRFKLTAGVVLIFVTGLLAGSFGTGLYVKHRIEGYKREGPPAITLLITKRISRELDLTKPQRKKIKEITERTQQRIASFRRNHYPELEQIINDSFRQIREVLRPEQRARLDRIHNRMKRRWHRRWDDQHPQPPPPRGGWPPGRLPAP